MRQWKKFDNRSVFDKDMDRSLWLTFRGHPVYKTSVRLRLEYYISAWSPHYAKDKELLEKVQTAEKIEILQY